MHIFIFILIYFHMNNNMRSICDRRSHMRKSRAIPFMFYTRVKEIFYYLYIYFLQGERTSHAPRFSPSDKKKITTFLSLLSRKRSRNASRISFSRVGRTGKLYCTMTRALRRRIKCSRAQKFGRNFYRIAFLLL